MSSIVHWSCPLFVRLRGVFLLNLNIAAGERAAGGVAVRHADRKGVRTPVLCVIGHTRVKVDGSPVQLHKPAKVRRTSRNGKAGNATFFGADIGCRIANGEITKDIIIALAHFELEGHWVARVIESAAAIDVTGQRDGRAVKLRARQPVHAAAELAARRQHRSVGKKRSGEVTSRLVEAARERPAPGGRVVQLGGREAAPGGYQHLPIR